MSVRESGLRESSGWTSRSVLAPELCGSGTGAARRGGSPVGGGGRTGVGGALPQTFLDRGGDLVLGPVGRVVGRVLGPGRLVLHPRVAPDLACLCGHLVVLLTSGP